MRDRAPRYPGRVKLVPVSGQTNVYDMTRLDQPTQVGDPMNKATFLKDATAVLYGLDADAVPDDVLVNIAEQLGERIRMVVGEYAGTGTAGVDNPNRLTAPFAPKLLIITSEGALRYVLIGIKGSPKVGNKTDSAGTDSMTFFEWGTNSVSWYAERLASYQYNESGKTYHYLIAG